MTCIMQLNAKSQTDTLFIYGPGGPLNAIKECSQHFSKETGIQVMVTGGPEEQWIDEAKKRADLIFGGSEYMLTQLAMKHANFIDPDSRISIHSRRVALLVRPGNPKKITSVEHLTKSGVKILDVNGAGQLGLWEDIAGRVGIIDLIQKNIPNSFVNTALAIQAWKNDKAYDAWITFASWHHNLKEETELIELPENLHMSRGTPFALTLNARNKSAADSYLHFLKSEQAKAIFKKWGW